MTALPRRSLAGVAGVLVAGLAGSAAVAQPDAQLLALVDQLVSHFKAERAALAVMTEEEQGAFHQARFIASFRGEPPVANVMANRIARIPATTSEGQKAKARALVWLHGGSDAGPLIPIGEGLLESLLADMTGTPCRFRPECRYVGRGRAI